MGPDVSREELEVYESRALGLAVTAVAMLSDDADLPEVGDPR